MSRSSLWRYCPHRHGGSAAVRSIAVRSIRPPALAAGLVLAVLLGAGLGRPVSSAEQGDGTAAAHYPAIVLADEPVAWWRFDEVNDDGEHAAVPNRAGNSDAAADLRAVAVGSILPVAGPRPERFPLFDPDNAAGDFNGQRGYLRVADPGEGSVLKFEQGDSITLEAWVNPRKLSHGQNMYVVGKGRTGNKGFAAENQNYALRLVGSGGTACVSFLFRNAGNSERNDFHRWTSTLGFPVGGGWHHVAVTYTFGKKDSIRGYIDGYSVTGKWDMGGATDKPPVVDDDELWIGSALRGSAGNTFDGLLDEVAIYRIALPHERLRLRYRAAEPAPEVAEREIPEDGVLVEILEDAADQRSWEFPPFAPPRRTDTWVEPAFAFFELPRKYSERAVQIDRSSTFLVRATGLVDIPAGEHRLLLRARNAARLTINEEPVLETPFFNINANAHGTIRRWAKVTDPDLRPLRTGDNESVTTFVSDGGVHHVALEFFVGGGGNRRPEVGETTVSLSRDGGPFHLLSPTLTVPLTDDGWLPFADETRARLAQLNAERRREAGAAEAEYWRQRHELARGEVAKTPGPTVPAVSGRTPVHNNIDRFIGAKLEEQGIEPAPLADDWAFLRRVSLDVIGTVPTPEMAEGFFADAAPDRRARLIDRLLDHPGWADHWVGYWQDVLAENPNIVNPTLNNTGPFRWWIHESFLDNKPFDRFATELVMMEGSRHYGGPAGFELATQNDAPMAAKAHIVGQAFLGMEMQCARCHDAPLRDFAQRDLFSLAAMLRRGAQPVPETSSIPLPAEAIASLSVQVTLKPGERVEPAWPFDELVPQEFPEGVLRNPGDSRERLAALITSPQNPRFAQVIVNRMWQRYLGRGFVEPVDDWDHPHPSHPELLDSLARKLVESGYDLKHVARLILNSHAYQRVPVGVPPVNARQPYDFAAPLRRRMTAEQLVDSLFVSAGKRFQAGDMNIDADGARPFTNSLNLGTPERAWHFSSTSNERDRPSLSLPLAEGFVSLLETYGWRSSRQDPVSVRRDETTVLQPAELANGVVGRRFTRLSEDSAFTALALLEDQPLEKLIERVYLRALTRPPTEEERALFTELLRDGYEDRRLEARPEDLKYFRPAPTGVSWSNHLSPESNEVQVALGRVVRAGDPPTVRLCCDWRERMEDMLWAILNSPEFVLVP